MKFVSLHPRKYTQINFLEKATALRRICGYDV